MNITVYSYRPNTREFQDAITIKKRGGSYQIPKDCTQSKPLEKKAGFAVIYNEDFSNSHYVEDHRQKTIYNTQAASESKVVCELGAIEKGWTLLAPTSENDIWIANEWQARRPSKDDAKVYICNQLNSKAGALGFENINNAVTYAEEPADKSLQNMGKALRAWRSLCWAYYRDTEFVDYDAFIAGLPTFNTKSYP